MEPPISNESVLVAFEQAFRLRLLARVHPLRNDMLQPSIQDSFEQVLVVESAIHQHLVDVNELLRRIE